MAFVDRDIQVGVGGVVRRDGAVLLVQMGYGGARGRWIIPGGYLEPGETGGAGGLAAATSPIHSLKKRRSASSRPRPSTTARSA